MNQDVQIAGRVEDWVAQASGKPHALHPQTRRVVGALRAAGVKRHQYRVLRAADQAYAWLVSEAARAAQERCGLLVACGLTAHLLDVGVLVHTDPDPVLVVHVTVVSHSVGARLRTCA